MILTRDALAHPLAVPFHRSVWALPLSIVVHVLVLCALMFSVAWPSEPPVALQAELWDAMPIAPAKAIAPATPNAEPSKLMEPTEPATSVVKPVAEPIKLNPTPTPAPAPNDATALSAIKQAASKPSTNPSTNASTKSKPALETPQTVTKQTQSASATQSSSVAKDTTRQKEIERMNALLDTAPIIAPAIAPVAAPLQAGAATGLGQSWGAKLKACVQPNLRYNDHSGSNPRVEFFVKLNPSGSPIDAMVSKSSGNTTFDAAVSRALLRCDPFPKPESGGYPPSLIVVYRLND